MLSKVSMFFTVYGVKKLISFIGCGPGSKEFLTLKGYDRIKNADVIIYAGSTVDHLLTDISRAEKIFDSSSMTLEDIEKVFSDHKSFKIVRMHSGDTSLYSAINEEIALADKNSIAFEVIPGISAYSYFASQLGIELTSPGICQSVVLTRLNGRTPVPENIEKFFGEQPSCAVYLSGCRPYEVLSLLKKYYDKDAILAIGTHLAREQERIEVKPLHSWHEINFPPNLTLFLVFRKGSIKSCLYDKNFSHGMRK